jgi:putative Mn2+ efflux pump MntP
LGVGWLPVAFAVAQFGMTLLGWLAGEVVATVAASAMRWLAVAVLGLLGGKMLFFAEDPSTDNRLSKPLSWKLVALLAVLTSVDAAAAGLALDQLTDVPLAACAVIGAVTLLMSMAGLAVGKRVGARVGVMGERLGGLVLVSLAVLVAVSGE